ncbi:MAG: phosphatase PAP2 family protein [Bacteroidota bacterium]
MRKVIEGNKLYFFLFLIWVVTAAVLLTMYGRGYYVLLFALERSELLDDIAQIVTRLGEELAFVVGLVILLFVRYRYALILPLVGGSVFLLSFTLKRFFGHPRPKVLFWRQIDSGGIILPDFYVNVGWNSFPSGHTMSAFALYTFIALVLSNKQWGPFLFLIAFAVGLTRIMLTQHFLMDVLAGSILGVFIAITFYLIQDKRPIDPSKWYDQTLFSKRN